MRPLRVSLALVSLLGCMVALIACEGQFGAFGRISGPTPAATPTPTPSPSPTATPLPPTPTPTPDPCIVKSVAISGETSVLVGEAFRIDVTPSGPAGPQEGSLDYCNKGGNGRDPRSVVVEEKSANLTCVGSCSGFVQTWKATLKGTFTLRLSVAGVISAPFSGEAK